MPRKRGGKKHRKRKAAQAQAQDPVVASLQRVQQTKEDQRDAETQKDAVDAHEGVQRAEKVAELHISGVDFNADTALVLQKFRDFYRNALSGVQPWHGMLIAWDISRLSPEEAVLGVNLVRAKRKLFPTQTHGGHGFVAVADASVADVFVRASRAPELNCTPAGRPERKREGVNIQRRRGSKKSVGLRSSKVVLGVTKVQLLDMDPRERQNRNTAGTQPVCCLWDAQVSAAWLDLQQRRIIVELTSNSAPFDICAVVQITVRVSVPITSVKSVKTMQARGRHFLALRTRRPPLVTEGDASEERPFLTTVDPSFNEAFSSPTAHFCLWFASESHFRESLSALKGFKIPVRGNTTQVSAQASALTARSQFLPGTTSLAHSLKGLSESGSSRLTDRDSFSVQYSLECLLKHGLLRSEDTCHLLGMLRDLYQWGESDTPVNELDMLVARHPPVHRCNRGFEAYEEVLDWHTHCASIQYYSTQNFNENATLSAIPTVVAGSMVQFSDEEADTDTESDDEGLARKGLLYLKKVLITPLRVLPYPATPEESSRILRQYSKFQDRFLRVGFANDNLQALNHTDLSDSVVQRFRSLMLDGLELCNRKFVFLGFSSSQQRDHGCWLYCEENRSRDGAPSAQDIRTAAGDLHDLRVASKYAARLAQCFSSTYDTFQLAAREVCTIPEVRSATGEMFSDGVGVITSEGMRRVIDKLPTAQQLRLIGADVAAIQIRMGGCKGVLARWDNASGMTRGALVGVRPSMQKFGCRLLSVEVCNLARVLPCFINRQVMMALLSLGIPSHTLWDMYEAYVADLEALLEGGPTALRVLATMGCTDPTNSSGLHVASSSLAACMIAAGLKPRSDPLLMGLVQAYRAFALKGIQEKCRLPVADGVTLMGIMDETGALPPGQFWASWDQSRDNRGLATAKAVALPPGTRALVSRAPCMSPSDIRVLTSADPSTLPQAIKALKNVIVFPKRGSRPEPCLMSGGDLDGDIYFIIWDKKLIPNREAPGLDYTPSQPPQEVPGGVVNVEHIVDAFINYMKNDQLGRIANGHLSLADGSPALANDDKCEALVMLHSTAVDFAKTGVPVNHEQVSQLLRDVDYPDYMHGDRKSETIIGDIYRDARSRRVDHAARANKEKTKRDSAVLGSRAFAVPGYEEHMAWAHTIVDRWTEEFADLMATYSVTDVGQVITGRVLQFYGLAVGREKNADHQQRLNRELARMCDRTRHHCFPDVRAEDVASVTESSATWFKGPRYGRTSHARTLASGIASLENLDEASLDETVRCASALYQAAYMPRTNAEGGSLDEVESVIRMALPWHMAPRLLARMAVCTSHL